VLIVDPFGRAFTGKNQNDAGEVTTWLTGLDQFAVDAGATELVLSVHAGWVEERSRGSSALEDWGDVVVNLNRGDPPSTRYLFAFGRDVEVEEDRLHFEPDTRTLTLTGSGSRKRERFERAIENVIDDVLDFVAEHPLCSGAAIRKGVDGSNEVVDKARRRLVEQGRLAEGDRGGRGGGKSYQVGADVP
jgi:hypothetical protein